MKGPHFGPKKVGKAAYAAQAAIVESKSHVFGHKKLSKSPQAAVEPKAEAPPAAPVKVSISVKALTATLKNSPETYEEMYAAELVREDGARKGALRIFLATEMALESPREGRVQEIESLLGG